MGQAGQVVENTFSVFGKYAMIVVYTSYIQVINNNNKQSRCFFSLATIWTKIIIYTIIKQSLNLSTIYISSI